MATHLVTGGSGFVGGHTVRALHCCGERVRVLDVIDSPERPADCTFIRASVLDRKAVRDAVDGVDYVHHNAALVPLAKAGAHFRQVNAEGTRAVSESALRAGVRFLVHVSSSAIFGAPRRCPVTDRTRPAPIEDYGRAKLEAEACVLQARSRGLRCAIFRPRTLVGPGRLGIFQILFEWMQEGRNLYVIGNGRNRFQFLHVSDLVTACLQSIRKDRPGIYNVGADRFGTLRDDLTAVARHAGSGSRVVGLPVGPAMATLKAADALRISPLAPWHYLTYHKPFYFDLTHAMSELAWQPAYGNREMLVEAYDWFVSSRRSGDAGGAGSIHRSTVRQGLLKLAKWLS